MAIACNRTMILYMRVVTLTISVRKMALIGGARPLSHLILPFGGLLKKHLQAKNLAQLKEGIQQFWLTLTPEVCTQYIILLKKVMPKVIEEEGGPSEF